MAEFPRLKTGAVMQYPAQRQVCYRTEVVRFVDGSEQRYREQAAGRKRWVIRLSALDDAELAALEDFFALVQGSASTFRFTDPWDGVTYESCSFEADSLALEYPELGRGRVMLVIREDEG